MPVWVREPLRAASDTVKLTPRGRSGAVKRRRVSCVPVILLAVQLLLSIAAL